MTRTDPAAEPQSDSSSDPQAIGKWEDEDDAPARPSASKRPAQRAKPSSNSPARPSFWNDPQSRTMLLLSAFSILGIFALGCFILTLLVLSGREVPFLSQLAREIGAGVNSTRVADDDTANEGFSATVNQTPVAISVPRRLSFAGGHFKLKPLSLGRDGKTFTYDTSAQNTAFWVQGTVVNYVVGLHASDANKAVFDALKPGDLTTLETTTGLLRFRVTEQGAVSEEQLATLMVQDGVRLTLILMGEGGNERRVTLAEADNDALPNQLTALGATTNLGGARVTAIDTRVSPEGAPAGTTYVQVNFEITNVMSDVLDASQFFSELHDGAGRVYALSPAGSTASGARGFGNGQIQPGETFSATAGFELPEPVSGPALEWRFALSASRPDAARVGFPYQWTGPEPTPSPEPTPAPKTRVLITAAEINPAGTELRVTGELENLGKDFLYVSLPDVQLASAAGKFSPVQSSLPAFPWSIEPGAKLTFQISFVRPTDAGPATFTFFGQKFEVSGF
jgi:hypothetical protein